MNADWTRHDLALDDPFAISRGETTTSTVFLVRLERDGVAGVGGATPSAYYGETPTSMAETVPDLLEVVCDADDPHAGQRIERDLRERAPDAPAARTAVTTALADLAARDLGVPLYRQLGLDPDAAPPTCYSIGIADPETTAERAAAAVDAGFDVLKVKLGADDDRDRLRAVREAAPDARIRVDANGAWDPDEALASAEWLADLDVEFVEQPVPGDDVAGLRRVAVEGPLPVCADESCVTAADVPAVADACDLVTVKLSKCGGVRPALRQIHAARAHDLDVMVGCMVESNASIAPGWHLAPLADHADLDGALLLAEDPCDGVPVEGGDADLRAVAAGTGARLTE